MSWGAVAGAAVSTVGGALLGGGGGGAPKWRPMNTENLWGSVTYNKKGRKMTQTLSPFSQQMANMFQMGALGQQQIGLPPQYIQNPGVFGPGSAGAPIGGPAGGLAQLLAGMGRGKAAGQGGGMMYAGGSPGFDMRGGQPPGGMGYGDLYANIGAGNVGEAYSQLQNYGLPPEALYQMAMTGMGNVAGGFQGLFNKAIDNPYAQEQMGIGRGLLEQGSNVPSYNDVYNQKLGLLRESAAPFEERAQNSLFNKMYATGQMGTPGGQLGIESWARGLGQADTSRQLDALGLSEGLYGRDLQAALARQQLGGNMFAGGAGNYLAGLNSAGQFGQLAGGAIGNMMDLGVNWNELGYSRGADRLSRASELFGFGTQLQDLPRQRQAQYLNMLSGITGEQTGLANLGLNAAGPGGGASTSGGGANWQNALGGFLGGISGAVGDGVSAWNRNRGLEDIKIDPQWQRIPVPSTPGGTYNPGGLI